MAQAEAHKAHFRTAGWLPHDRAVLERWLKDFRLEAKVDIHIAADHPGLGRLVVTPIGMGEIRSCVIDARVAPGARVEKGQELGYFQYGGSTLVCLFRKDALEGFSPDAIPDPEHDEARPIRVNAPLARAKRA